MPAYALFPSQAEAAAALTAVNQAYAATVQEVRGDGTPAPQPPVTQAWAAHPIICAEGWAIPMPPAALAHLLGEHQAAAEITPAPAPDA